MNTMINGGMAATMTSREISDLVEARHNDVVATIERLFAKGLLRSSRKTRREATGGRPIDVYDLIERDTHLVVAGYSDEHRARVIDRWQELEAKQPAAAAFLIPRTLPDALRLAADESERADQAEAALAIAAPKAEFVDRYVDATGNKGFRQVAKLLKANEARFREFLEAKSIMYRLGGEWTPYQNHIDVGRFVVKTGVSESEHAYTHAKFTPKGVKWIASLWAIHDLFNGDEQEAA